MATAAPPGPGPKVPMTSRASGWALAARANESLAPAGSFSAIGVSNAVTAGLERDANSWVPASVSRVQVTQSLPAASAATATLRTEPLWVEIAVDFDAPTPRTTTRFCTG